MGPNSEAFRPVPGCVSAGRAAGPVRSTFGPLDGRNLMPAKIVLATLVSAVVLGWSMPYSSAQIPLIPTPQTPNLTKVVAKQALVFIATRKPPTFAGTFTVSLNLAFD